MKYRILFISKDMVFKKAMSVILSKNFDARVFHEDEMAEDMFLKHDMEKVDFVIVDMDFFNTDKFEKLRLLKKNCNDCNFIAMQNNTSPVDLDKSLFMGAISKNKISIGFASALNKLNSKDKQSKPSGLIAALDKLENTVSMVQLLNIMNKRRSLV